MKDGMWLNRFNKRRVREKIFKNNKFTKLVGLAGDDLRSYIRYFRKKGIIEFHVYEKDRSVALTQHEQFVGMHFHDIMLTTGDILKAAFLPDVLYDLDFCCCITTAKEHVKKFRKNFVFTFCLRPTNLEETIALFAEYRGETLSKVTENKIFTSRGIYHYESYVSNTKVDDDRGSTMVCIHDQKL